MIRPILSEEKDKLPDSFANFVILNALNIPLALDAAPTTVGNQLPSNGDCGFYSTNLYINLNGTVYRLSMTAV